MTATRKSAPAATETLFSQDPSTPVVNRGLATRKVSPDGPRVNAPRRAAAARALRVPHAAVSYEENLQVYNEDLYDMTSIELESAVQRTVRIVDRDPGAFVWRGLEHITAREWGDERLAIIRQLQRPERTASIDAVTQPEAAEHVSVGGAGGWSVWR